MAERKYLSYAGLSKYDELIKALIESKDAAILAAAKEYVESLADNYEAAGSVASAKAELQALIDAVEAEIEKMNSGADAEGSVDYKIAAAKKELGETIAATDKKADDAQAAADAAQDYAEALELRVKANEDAIGDVDNLETTAKNLADALNEVRNAVSAGGTAAAITLDTTTTTEGALKSYTIKQGENVVGTIDIPKDMVVQSGEVVQLEEGAVAGYEAGTYIKLVLANATNDVIYVNVGNLVDIYKAQANAPQIQLAIDASTREISATIVAESVTATELATDAVTTVKIADGNVTKAKLSTAVQASLDKADAAATQAALEAEIDRAEGAEKALSDRLDAVEDKAHEHANKALLDTYTQTEADLADAVAKKHEHTNKDVLDGITAAKVSNWDAAEGNAKAYTDELKNGTVKANSDAISNIKNGESLNSFAAVEGSIEAVEGRLTTLENADTYVAISTDEINGLFAQA